MGLRSVTFAILLGLAGGVIGACDWGSGTWSQVAGYCTNDDCGLLCGKPLNVINGEACQNMPGSTQGCCICRFRTWVCNCTFGEGTGRDATQLETLTGRCSSGAGCILEPG